MACLALRQELEKVGVTLQLRELSAGASTHPADDVDLVYAELAMSEPVVDAQRLLGEGGLSRSCSPAMTLTLRQLAQATEPAQARIRLRRVHRLAHEESAVIPLWQLTDYFACQSTLKGIAKETVSLYQNVEKWNVEFSYPGK
jgi:MarR-like DNA-binding transcriptional regulator SgrR of sgrS sRNA